MAKEIDLQKLDDQLDAEQDGVMFESVADDRNVTSSIRANAADLGKGIATVGNLKNIGTHILGTMPQTSSLMSEISAINQISASAQNDFRKEFIKVAEASRKLTKYVMPKVKRYMPKKIANRLENFSKDRVVAKRDTDKQILDAEIKGKLDAIFETSVTGVKTSAEQDARALLNEMQGISERRSQTQLLTSINSHMMFSNKFTSTTRKNYMRKMLELTYRQTYLAKDQLTQLKTLNNAITSSLAAIIKNTSLPDSLKFQGVERGKAQLYGRLYDKGMDKVSDIAKNASSAFKSNITDNLDGIAAAMDMGVDGLEANDEMNEMFGVSRASRTGSTIGGIGSRLVGKYVSKKAGGALNHLDMRAKGITDSFSSGGRGALLNFSNSDNKLLRGISQFMGSPDVDIVPGNSMLDRGNDASQFDILTRQTIVEIIPAWLSKIAKNTKDIFEGYATEDEQYDVTTRSIVTKGVARENIASHIFGKQAERSAGYTQSVGATLQAIDNSNLSIALDRKTLNNNISKVIANAIAIRLPLRPAYLKKYLTASTDEELIEDKNMKRLFQGVQDKLTTLQALYFTMTDEKGKENFAITSSINAGIYREMGVGGSDFQTKLSTMIDGYGYGNLFSDKIDANGVLSQDWVTSEIGNITPDRLSSEIGGGRRAHLANMQKNNENMAEIEGLKRSSLNMITKPKDTLSKLALNRDEFEDTKYSKYQDDKSDGYKILKSSYKEEDISSVGKLLKGLGLSPEQDQKTLKEAYNLVQQVKIIELEKQLLEERRLAREAALSPEEKKEKLKFGRAQRDIPDVDYFKGDSEAGKYFKSNFEKYGDDHRPFLMDVANRIAMRKGIVDIYKFLKARFSSMPSFEKGRLRVMELLGKSLNDFPLKVMKTVRTAMWQPLKQILLSLPGVGGKSSWLGNKKQIEERKGALAKAKQYQNEVRRQLRTMYATERTANATEQTSKFTHNALSFLYAIGKNQKLLAINDANMHSDTMNSQSGVLGFAASMKTPKKESLPNTTIKSTLTGFGFGVSTSDAPGPSPKPIVYKSTKVGDILVDVEKISKARKKSESNRIRKERKNNRKGSYIDQIAKEESDIDGLADQKSIKKRLKVLGARDRIKLEASAGLYAFGAAAIYKQYRDISKYGWDQYKANMSVRMGGSRFDSKDGHVKTTIPEESLADLRAARKQVTSEVGHGDVGFQNKYIKLLEANDSEGARKYAEEYRLKHTGDYEGQFKERSDRKTIKRLDKLVTESDIKITDDQQKNLKALIKGGYDAEVKAYYESIMNSNKLDRFGIILHDRSSSQARNKSLSLRFKVIHALGLDSYQRDEYVKLVRGKQYNLAAQYLWDVRKVILSDRNPVSKILLGITRYPKVLVTRFFTKGQINWTEYGINRDQETLLKVLYKNKLYTEVEWYLEDILEDRWAKSPDAKQSLKTNKEYIVGDVTKASAAVAARAPASLAGSILGKNAVKSRNVAHTFNKAGELVKITSKPSAAMKAKNTLMVSERFQTRASSFASQASNSKITETLARIDKFTATNSKTSKFKKAGKATLNWLLKAVAWTIRIISKIPGSGWLVRLLTWTTNIFGKAMAVAAKWAGPIYFLMLALGVGKGFYLINKDPEGYAAFTQRFNWGENKGMALFNTIMTALDPIDTGTAVVSFFHEATLYKEAVAEGREAKKNAEEGTHQLFKGIIAKLDELQTEDGSSQEEKSDQRAMVVGFLQQFAKDSGDGYKNDILTKEEKQKLEEWETSLKESGEWKEAPKKKQKKKQKKVKYSKEVMESGARTYDAALNVMANKDSTKEQKAYASGVMKRYAYAKNDSHTERIKEINKRRFELAALDKKNKLEKNMQDIESFNAYKKYLTSKHSANTKGIAGLFKKYNLNKLDIPKQEYKDLLAIAEELLIKFPVTVTSFVASILSEYSEVEDPSSIVIDDITINGVLCSSNEGITTVPISKFKTKYAYILSSFVPKKRKLKVDKKSIPVPKPHLRQNGSLNPDGRKLVKDPNAADNSKVGTVARLKLKHRKKVAMELALKYGATNIEVYSAMINLGQIDEVMDMIKESRPITRGNVTFPNGRVIMVDPKGKQLETNLAIHKDIDSKLNPGGVLSKKYTEINKSIIGKFDSAKETIDHGGQAIKAGKDKVVAAVSPAAMKEQAKKVSNYLSNLTVSLFVKTKDGVVSLLPMGAAITIIKGFVPEGLREKLLALLKKGKQYLHQVANILEQAKISVTKKDIKRYVSTRKEISVKFLEGKQTLLEEYSSEAMEYAEQIKPVLINAGKGIQSKGTQAIKRYKDSSVDDSSKITNPNKVSLPAAGIVDMTAKAKAALQVEELGKIIDEHFLSDAVKLKALMVIGHIEHVAGLMKAKYPIKTAQMVDAEFKPIFKEDGSPHMYTPSGMALEKADLIHEALETKVFFRQYVKLQMSKFNASMIDWKDKVGDGLEKGKNSLVTTVDASKVKLDALAKHARVKVKAVKDYISDLSVSLYLKMKDGTLRLMSLEAAKEMVTAFIPKGLREKLLKLLEHGGQHVRQAADIVEQADIQIVGATIKKYLKFCKDLAVKYFNGAKLFTEETYASVDKAITEAIPKAKTAITNAGVSSKDAIAKAGTASMDYIQGKGKGAKVKFGELKGDVIDGVSKSKTSAMASLNTSKRKLLAFKENVTEGTVPEATRIPTKKTRVDVTKQESEKLLATMKEGGPQEYRKFILENGGVVSISKSRKMTVKYPAGMFEPATDELDTLMKLYDCDEAAARRMFKVFSERERRGDRLEALKMDSRFADSMTISHRERDIRDDDRGNDIFDLDLYMAKVNSKSIKFHIKMGVPYLQTESGEWKAVDDKGQFLDGSDNVALDKVKPKSEASVPKKQEGIAKVKGVTKGVDGKAISSKTTPTTTKLTKQSNSKKIVPAKPMSMALDNDVMPTRQTRASMKDESVDNKQISKATNTIDKSSGVSSAAMDKRRNDPDYFVTELKSGGTASVSKSGSVSVTYPKGKFDATDEQLVEIMEKYACDRAGAIRLVGVVARRRRRLDAIEAKQADPRFKDSWSVSARIQSYRRDSRERRVFDKDKYMAAHGLKTLTSKITMGVPYLKDSNNEWKAVNMQGVFLDGTPTVSASPEKSDQPILEKTGNPISGGIVAAKKFTGSVKEHSGNIAKNTVAGFKEKRAARLDNTEPLASIDEPKGSGFSGVAEPKGSGFSGVAEPKGSGFSGVAKPNTKYSGVADGNKPHEFLLKSGGVAKLKQVGIQKSMSITYPREFRISSAEELAVIMEKYSCDDATAERIFEVQMRRQHYQDRIVAKNYFGILNKRYKERYRDELRDRKIFDKEIYMAKNNLTSLQFKIRKGIPYVEDASGKWVQVDKSGNPFDGGKLVDTSNEKASKPTSIAGITESDGATPSGISKPKSRLSKSGGYSGVSANWAEDVAFNKSPTKKSSSEQPTSQSSVDQAKAAASLDAGNNTTKRADTHEVVALRKDNAELAGLMKDNNAKMDVLITHMSKTADNSDRFQDVGKLAEATAKVASRPQATPNQNSRVPEIGAYKVRSFT